MTDDFRYAKRAPWAHQLKGFELSKDARAFAYFCEQRTGKNLLTLAVAARAYEQGKINALLISAPSGVQRDWVVEAIPENLPDWTNPLCNIWRPGSKTETLAQEALLTHPGLSILAINVEALITARARTYLAAFVKQRKVMFVADESSDFSSPSAKRTRVAWAIAKRCHMVRILDGTPNTESPLELYAQVGLLTPAPFGFTSFYTFKHHFAEWEKGFNGQTGTEYEALKQYQNLDELQEKLSKFSYRVLRRDCKDIPEKVYGKRFFKMTDMQAKVYRDLREEYIAELADMKRVTATHVLARATRLLQIACGFVTPDREAHLCTACNPEDPDGDCRLCQGLGLIVDPKHPPVPIGNENPRLDALVAEVRLLHEPFVIWARFHHDLDIIIPALEAIGKKMVRYDGTVHADQRQANKLAFQRGEVDGLAGNPAAGARGLMLARASTTLFYSNGQSLRKRLQAEDRTENLNKTTGNSVMDIIGEDTVDIPIVQAFRDKKALSDLILGDRPGAFL